MESVYGEREMSELENLSDGIEPGSDAPPIDVDANGYVIRHLTTAAEMRSLIDVFQQVWGSATELVRLEMLMAIAHSGGYVTALYATEGREEPAILGASVGILARHRGRPALHSHVTGVLPGARRHGLGRRMKLHQRDWAIQNGLEWIVWTFDPLVRRNAWFNIAVLGTVVEEYVESFYGTMTDALNSGDVSDRLVVGWDLSDDPDGPLLDGTDVDGSPLPDVELIPTPEDVVTLRRTDPGAVAEWRADHRRRLEPALAAGRRVLGFTRDGHYVVALDGSGR